MEAQQTFDRLGADVVPVLDHDRGDPRRLAWALDVIDLRFAPPRVHDDEPDQPGSHDEPDDEQPDVELGGHRGPV